MSTGSAGEPYGLTLVLTLVTGQMVTLNTSHTRIGNHWLSEQGGMETLEWLLGSGSQQAEPGQAVSSKLMMPDTRCVFSPHAPSW